MKPSLRPDSITLDDFRAVLSRYDSAVSAEAKPLQDQRWKIIPETLATRRKNGNAYLEKPEILVLVDWRVKHAFFPRELPIGAIPPGQSPPPPPSATRIAELIESNSEEALHTATKALFSTYDANRLEPGKAIADLVVRSPVNGFGAPTASLVLSVYDPENIAFFSDECYKWMLWRNKERSRWDRKIRYEIRAWKNMHAKIQALRQRLGEDITAADIEKVAYVIAKEDDGKEDGEEEGPKRKRRKKMSSLDSTESELEDFSNQADSICLKKGPLGSPTYDDLGYEQDYNLVARSRGPPRRLGKKAEKRLEEKMEEGKQKSKIIGWEERSGNEETSWDDRVARDLGKPFHTITVRDYEEWKKRGFTIQEWMCDHRKQDKEEDDRLLEIQCGCAFRKGYVG